jgi:dTMP kinase
VAQLHGKFIVFDGGEGCGKSTQATLLREALLKRDVQSVLVRDPGSTRIGEMVRTILLNPDNTEIAMRCEMLLYMAARAQMMQENILPALKSGKCVISDRFVSSTLAYQLGGDGLTADEIRNVAQVAIGGRWPDLTIILDMPVEKSSARLQRARDRIEQRPMEYHQRVRQNYLMQAEQNPKNVRVISADREPQIIHAEVMNLVATLL